MGNTELMKRVAGADRGLSDGRADYDPVLREDRLLDRPTEILDRKVQQARAKSPRWVDCSGGTCRFESDARITVCVGVARIEVERGFDRAVLGEVMRVAASIC